MSVTDALAHRAASPAISRKGFIAGPAYDMAFFILAPLWSLALGLALADGPAEAPFFADGRSWLDAMLGIVIFSHLVIVIFRSHVNQTVFRRFPLRFTVVPVLVWAAFNISPWILVAGSVLGTFWDVYHSGMQTFGLGRIYDAKAGNPPLAGRRLDMVLNLLLYAGPIAAGATMMDHVEDFNEFADVGAVFFLQVPAWADSHHGWMTWAVVAFAGVFLPFYLYRYWRMAAAGYRVSWQKIALVLATAVTSVWAWGFNPFGMAFFIMNIFHAIQYFAIVWYSEKGGLARTMGVEGRPWSAAAALAVIVAVGAGYGVLVEFSEAPETWLYSLFLVISLMHFWYDGFVWSVRRKEV